MKVTQGQFSFLPDLTDAEIGKQIEYALDNGWACWRWSTRTIRIRATVIGRCGGRRCSTCVIRRG